jgi:hypothetical protein
MRMKYFFLGCAFFSACMTFAQSDCELKREKDLLKVYVCKPPDSKLKAVKVSLQVESSLSKIAGMILDVSYYKEWQYATVQASVIKQVSENELYYYHEVAAPLVDNRDFAVRLTIYQDAQTRELTITALSVPDYLPRKKGVVRVPYSLGLWKVRPLTHNRVQIDYSVQVDLGGHLPQWIISPLAPKASFETFDSFRKKIPTYKGKPASFIKDH